MISKTTTSNCSMPERDLSKWKIIWKRLKIPVLFSMDLLMMICTLMLFFFRLITKDLVFISMIMTKERLFNLSKILMPNKESFSWPSKLKKFCLFHVGQILSLFLTNQIPEIIKPFLGDMKLFKLLLEENMNWEKLTLIVLRSRIIKTILKNLLISKHLMKERLMTIGCWWIKVKELSTITINPPAHLNKNYSPNYSPNPVTNVRTILNWIKREFPKFIVRDILTSIKIVSQI